MISGSIAWGKVKSCIICHDLHNNGIAAQLSIFASALFCFSFAPVLILNSGQIKFHIWIV